MRIFLASAGGVIGVRLIPPLVAGGHVVVGVTRTPMRGDGLARLARPIVEIVDPV